jgi:hypothetical protein
MEAVMFKNDNKYRHNGGWSYPKPTHPDEPAWQYEMRVKDYATSMQANIMLAAIVGGFVGALVMWN